MQQLWRSVTISVYNNVKCTKSHSTYRNGRQLYPWERCRKTDSYIMQEGTRLASPQMHIIFAWCNYARWTLLSLMCIHYLSVCPCLSLSFCLPDPIQFPRLHLSLFLVLLVCLSMSLHPSFSLYISMSIPSLSLSLSLSLYIYIYIYIYIWTLRVGFTLISRDMANADYIFLNKCQSIDP